MTATHPAPLSAEQRHRMIAEAAYYLAEQRSFQEGDPTADWLLAEIEIERMLDHAPAPKAPVKRKPRTVAPKPDKASPA